MSFEIGDVVEHKSDKGHVIVEVTRPSKEGWFEGVVTGYVWDTPDVCAATRFRPWKFKPFEEEKI